MSAPNGINYSENQLQRALDALARAEPAQGRVSRWRAVVDGLLSGDLLAGSRKPIDRYPEWVSLEVVTGGFATGAALAAGPLQPHETRLLVELEQRDTASPRLALNRYFLSDAGQAQLLHAVASQRLSIDVAEESVLPVVAWLAVHGHAYVASELVDAIAPFVHELRFYPQLDVGQREPVGDGRVHLESVGQVIERLRAINEKPRVASQRDALAIWTPLYDAAIGLVLETVDGALPVALKDDAGHWLRGERGQFVLNGGWPFRHVPAGWPERAQALIAQVAHARSQHSASRRFSGAGEPFAVLMTALSHAASAPEQLTGREVGRVRLIVARYVALRGAPDSAAAQAERARQRSHASARTHRQLASAVADRLAARMPSAGIMDLDAVLQGPAALATEAGTAAPAAERTSAEPALASEASTSASTLARSERKARASVLRRLQRCIYDSPEGLIGRGVVRSAEVLARLLPQRTSQLRAASFDDEGLRTLYAATYQAFRRRRSLLLLDLQKQVQIDELPWVAAMNRFRDADAVASQAASAALDEFASLALTQFPQTMLPNKLLQEFVALANEAGRPLPLTEELAADIFMGRFSPKFVAAARVAAAHLQDSLYARYYRIDYQDIARRLSITAKEADSEGASGEVLAALCAERAGEQLGTWSAAGNGRIIEQQLILTSHNLALLCDLPDVRHTLEDRADQLARACYAWVLRHLQLTGGGWRAELHRIKNAAYAWRQMVFFLSLRPAQASAFLGDAEALLDRQEHAFAQRFRPALHGLRVAVDTPAVWLASQEPAPFLGWHDTERWRVRSD